MKIIVSIFLCVSICFTSCDKNHDGPNTHPRDPYLVEICFVDEMGNYLVKNLAMKFYNELGYAYVEDSEYRLSWMINGDALDKGENLVIAMPAKGIIMFPFAIRNWVDRSKYSDDPESIWVSQLNFKCPKLYGDDSEHILVVEQKLKNDGRINKFERLLYDGEVIATDCTKVPFVIVVPQK